MNLSIFGNQENFLYNRGICIIKVFVGRGSTVVDTFLLTTSPLAGVKKINFFVVIPGTLILSWCRPSAEQLCLME